MDRLYSTHRLDYQFGLVACLGDIRYVPIQTFAPEDIDDSVVDILSNLDLFHDDNILGDLFTGEPIQIDRLMVYSGLMVRDIVCYNRYVQMRHELPEFFQAFHIVCETLGRGSGHELRQYKPPHHKRRGKEGRALHRGAFNRRLREKISKRFHGFPVLLLDTFGPDDRRASKVEISVLDPVADEGVTYVRESDSDARYDEKINRTILDVVDYYGVKTVRASEGVVGCPHEEARTIRRETRVRNANSGRTGHRGRRVTSNRSR